MSHGVRLALPGVLPLAILLLGLFLLQEILLPFVVGMAAAYLLDPAADGLQRIGFGRTTATVTIILGLFVVLLVAAVIGVFIRFGLERYRASALFNGPSAAGSGGREPRP